MTVETQDVVKAAGSLEELLRRLRSDEGVAEIATRLAEGQPVDVCEVHGSACALVAGAVESSARPLVAVCESDEAAEGLSDDFALFTGRRAARFPALEGDFTERLLYDDRFGDRLRTLKALSRGEVPRLIVAGIQSLLQPTPSPDRLAAETRRIESGERLELEELLKWLARLGFHATSAVELPGEFSHRGGIVDIFAPDWHEPVRIELWGDEVESLRQFDVATQRSTTRLDACEITLLSPARDDRGSLADHLPPGTAMLLIEPQKLQEAAAHYLERVEDPDSFHSFPALMRRADRFGRASFYSLAPAGLGAEVRLGFQSVERFSGEIGRVRRELEEVAGEADVHLICPTEAESQRLAELLAESPVHESGRLHFAIGRLFEGFRHASSDTIVISSGELFHRSELRRPATRTLGKAIDSFVDLREGDLVVHLSHGIGRYRGLKLLTKDQQVEEHLEIEFAGRTKIYVPATRIGLVQKYIGSGKARPRLAKIGGRMWQRQKKAAEAAVTDMAQEMIDLQAERASRSGIAFAADTLWQREFDASFPYTETADQLRAMEEMKRDMQTPRPMDRLLCGDVGFGKTELAIRAAFKAVDNGYQVAVLVPTTVLAEQHFRTFRERMSEFPFEIVKLSRFSTAAEQRQVIEGLKQGRHDIVIGTHRLASQDVGFENLGLLIIDEEQRFGVEVKERLKALRATVDILTMSATPIPRTLHMSLVGLRDISNLETAPADRMAVETRVARFDDEMIRHAVLRELSRGGQIFFVHNRIADIHALARRLEDIVPEADIRVGHGQMPEGELEEVMVDFVQGKFDLLLSTTIVESGLDIPNANTIFIDEADRYGLSELHQLRGRVGRYKHRAYCYLLIDPAKSLTPNAARRLRAIEEYSEMGAGFSIAMRDLEIRGAGNLLGTQQSGHIAAVGYELYCQLMETAVNRLKRRPPKLSIDVDVDLPGEAYLPEDYVGDMRQKIDLYRRLARIDVAERLDEIRAELIDRFGPVPAPAERMLQLAELQMEAAVWSIHTIRTEGRYVVLDYNDPQRIEQLKKDAPAEVRIADERSAYVPLPCDPDDADGVLAHVNSLLRAR